MRRFATASTRRPTGADSKSRGSDAVSGDRGSRGDRTKVGIPREAWDLRLDAHRPRSCGSVAFQLTLGAGKLPLSVKCRRTRLRS
jgi:hypothetical protein